MAFYGHYPHQFLANAQGNGSTLNQFPHSSASGQSSTGPSMASSTGFGYSSISSNPTNMNSQAFSNTSAGFSPFNAISSAGNPTSQLQNAFQSFQNLWYSQTNTYSTSTVATPGTASANQQTMNRNDFSNTTQNVLYQSQMSRFPQALNYLQQQAALQGQFKNTNHNKPPSQTVNASQSQSPGGWNTISTSHTGFTGLQQASSTNKVSPSTWNNTFPQQQKDWTAAKTSTYQSPYQSQPSGYFGNAGGDFNWPGQQQQQSQQPQSHSFNNHQQSGATGGQQQLRNSNSNNAFSTTAFNNNSNSLTGGQPSSNRTGSLALHDVSSGGLTGGVSNRAAGLLNQPKQPIAGGNMPPPSNIGMPQNFTTVVPTTTNQQPPQWNTPPPGPNWPQQPQNNSDPRRRNEQQQRSSFIPPFPEAWQGNGVIRQPTPQMPSEQGGWGEPFAGSWTAPPPVGNQWSQPAQDFDSANRTGQTAQNRFTREQQARSTNRYSPKSRGEKSDRELWTPGDNKKQQTVIKPKTKDDTITAKDGLLSLDTVVDADGTVVLDGTAVPVQESDDGSKVIADNSNLEGSPNNDEMKQGTENTGDKSIQSTEIKSYLYAWLGMRHRKPSYEMRTLGERPDQTFRCELHVQSYKFIGVGEASTKKEAQTEAAWNFVDFLVKENEMKPEELPPKHKKSDIVVNGGGSPDTTNSLNKPNAKKSPNDVPNNNVFDKRDRHNRQRSGPVQQMNMNKPPPPPQAGKIPSLLSIVTTPRNLPPMPPPYLFERMPGPWAHHPPQHPPFRIRGHWEGPRGMPPHPLPPHIPHMMPPHPHGFPPPGPMGPPHMGPPPMMPHHGPVHRRGGPRPEDVWRHQREMEEQQWFEEMDPDMNPEDIFINRMIKNQQAAARMAGGGVGPPTPSEGMGGDWPPVPPGKMRQITLDDRHVMAKHAVIYPHEEELKAVHEIVTVTERALKSLSDQFVDEDHPLPKDEEEENSDTTKRKQDGKTAANQDEEKKSEADVKTEAGQNEKGEGSSPPDDEKSKDEEERKPAKIQILKRPKKLPKKMPDTRPRVLCGVNRVGPLAKGLLINGDSHVSMVLLCGTTPTKALLSRIMKHLPAKVEEVKSDMKFKLEEDECGFSVLGDLLVPIKLSVTMTSTAFKTTQKQEEDKKDEETCAPAPTEDAHKTEEDAADVKENSEVQPDCPPPTATTTTDSGDPTSPEGMLPKPLLLRALAQLRHAKWFQAKASQIDCCVVITRILRDLQCRNEAWSHLSCWALENLVYVSLSSSTEQMGLGDALRRFFEVVAGGILLPDSSGIQDPCERAQTDILDCCTPQQLEDITKHAQHSLLKIAFREMHQVLGIEKIVPVQNHHRNHQHHHQPQSYHHMPPPPPHTPETSNTDDEAANHQRKRKNPQTNNDTSIESPKRTLTDEETSNNETSEHTDTQQTLAELSISETPDVPQE